MIDEIDVFVCVPHDGVLCIWKGVIRQGVRGVTIIRINTDGTESATTLPPGTPLPVIDRILTDLCTTTP